MGNNSFLNKVVSSLFFPNIKNENLKGGVVYHDGQSKTVGKGSLKYDSFAGYTLFGDSYLLGRESVIRYDGRRKAGCC